MLVSFFFNFARTNLESHYYYRQPRTPTIGRFQTPQVGARKHNYPSFPRKTISCVPGEQFFVLMARKRSRMTPKRSRTARQRSKTTPKRSKSAPQRSKTAPKFFFVFKKDDSLFPKKTIFRSRPRRFAVVNQTDLSFTTKTIRCSQTRQT